MDAAYTSIDGVDPTASLTITFKRDGTWAITVGAGDGLGGTPASGNWAASPEATSGDSATVIYATANPVNAPSITNNAATDTPLTGDVTIVISKGGGTQATIDVTCTVKSGASQVAETTNILVDGT